LNDIAQCRVDILALYALTVAKIADDVADLSEAETIDGKLTTRGKKDLEKNLAREVTALAIAIEARIGRAIERSYSLGASPIIELAADAFAEIATPAKIRKALESVTSRAANAYKAEARFGRTFSERIWTNAAKTSATIQDIVRAGLAEGYDATRIAKALEGYVKEGSKTLSSHYPNMMARMNGRVPGNLSYESLRLARTEASRAFNDGTIAAAMENPAIVAIGFRLSRSHPVPDICDSLATQNLFGLGAGNYPPEEAPSTQHPCCLCYLVPIGRNIDDAIARWKVSPDSEPNIEEFAETVGAA
jgi:hypothetical protein